MSVGRNYDKRTSEAEARANILSSMAKYREAIGMATIGETAFPGYRFASRQGAALAVSRIARRLQDEGLIHLRSLSHGGTGYIITDKGCEAAAQQQRGKP